MLTKYRFAVGLAAVSTALSGIIMLSERSTTAAETKSENEAAFTTSGQDIYERNCLACHAVDGHGGGKYPNIVSDKFKKGKGKSYDTAYNFISQNMPENAPGSLREEEYKAVVKYVLALNGTPTDFSDIVNYWARKEITSLYDNKYIDGYTSNGQLLFKPDQDITRAEFIRYLVKAKELYLSNTTEIDLKDIGNSKDKIYIITAVEYGLIDGYPDHTFQPTKKISRAEIAAILSRSELYTPLAAEGFKDVPAEYWANKQIGAVSHAKLFNGYDDGTFRPGQFITRGEAAAVIYRLLNPNS
jgi:mono/diheme cytochrome c family protein